MIYQCYFKQDQETMLFQSPVYQGFGLEPEINSSIFVHCPELENPMTRLQLCEYACLLWHWRNPGRNPDPWIGTTSYRQLDKSKTVFYDPEKITRITENNKIASWGIMNLISSDKIPLTLSQHSDILHPGFNKFIEHVFLKFSHKVPDGWNTQTAGIFANYWALNLELLTHLWNFHGHL